MLCLKSYDFQPLRFLALLCAGALAATPAFAQDIENVAVATWNSPDGQRTASSNPVVTRIEMPQAEVSMLLAGTAGQTNVQYFASRCGATNDGSSSPDAGDLTTSSASPTTELRAGDTLLLSIAAPLQNTEANAIESVTVSVMTGGDRETITVFEDAPNSGIFVGSIASRRLFDAAASDNCAIEISEAGTVDIVVRSASSAQFLGSARLDVRASSLGIVFDSETGAPVSGARIRLVDAQTDQPAVVFAEDGTTSWPATIVSGATITDQAGRVYPMGIGEYWFPMVATGLYRLIIEPPEPYSAPSTAPVETLTQLTRQNGAPFELTNASFGVPFTLGGLGAITVNVPVDRQNSGVGLTKTASRQRAQPGDTVFYTIELRNTDTERPATDVTIVDVAPRWLRYRLDTLRIDGKKIDELGPGASLVAAPDGSHFTLGLGTLGPGETRQIRYGMIVRADAPPGRAVNKVESRDGSGNVRLASADVLIERDLIAGRMTVIGRVVAGGCEVAADGPGVAGVRVMMEDGSFAITDADGRYHFEGVVPGTHVVRAMESTLPDGTEFVDCTRSARTLGKTDTRLVEGGGGALLRADFHVTAAPKSSLRLDYSADLLTGDPLVDSRAPFRAAPSPAPDQDWLALGDGPDGWLTPTETSNPRAPAIKVAFRHRRGQTIRLFVDGQPVNPVSFDGTLQTRQGSYAVSVWRGIPLADERTVLTAEIVNSLGVVAQTMERTVYFTSDPANVAWVENESRLLADGVTRPILAVRITDRNGRPVRQGVSGSVTINAPYQSASQIEQQEFNRLAQTGQAAARWVIDGDDGIARIELAPSMISGPLRAHFTFRNDNVERREFVEAWVVPGKTEWTIVGLGEGFIGASNLADNMELGDDFDSDLGKNARLALYTKGRILGKYLVTVAYDSAAQQQDRRLLGALDPDAYYTVYGDNSGRGFDAASREKLYVRVESARFTAVYGDFQTAFDQTHLGRYQRTTTGLSVQARTGAIKVGAFAANVSTRSRRDEIQGNGLSGPYQLSIRDIVANSETVTVETRDRFRSELIVASTVLNRFEDYDVDLLSGTIMLTRPLASRDFDLNPQFLVITYETLGTGGGDVNAGARIEYANVDDTIAIGATLISDSEAGQTTDLVAVDVRARVAPGTEIRAELGASNDGDGVGEAWMVEARHQADGLDMVAYEQKIAPDYGVGQQNAAELGREKIGLDANYQVSDSLNAVTSVWQDNSLSDDARRRAVEANLIYQGQFQDFRVGVSRFEDRLADRSLQSSTVLEAGSTVRLLSNRLQISATGSVALEGPDSVDLPNRYVLDAGYAITPDLRATGIYERAEGAKFDAQTFRGGIEYTPWQGGRAKTGLGQQRLAGVGTRDSASYGLSQSIQATRTLTVDATVDGNQAIGGTPQLDYAINSLHPTANGGPTGFATGLGENFTAVTFGGAWRCMWWNVTGRAEYRDGQFSDRWGIMFNGIRRLENGMAWGSRFSWTHAVGAEQASTEIIDASLGFAYRPTASQLVMLSKLEFRSDAVANAVNGRLGPVGRTALTIDGDALFRRLLASLSVNWSPRGRDLSGNVISRDELSLFLATRYGLDTLEDVSVAGWTALAGLEGRLGLSQRIDIGGSVNMRSNVTAGITSYSFGPQIGVSPLEGMLFTFGYNVQGFEDIDFSAARNISEGGWINLRFAFDEDVLAQLGVH